jgi:hypothetical protein
LPADELTPFVEKLAHRIASFPVHAIAHAKAAVDTGALRSMAAGLLVEAHESDLSVASEVTQTRVTEALKAGAETYEGELEMDFIDALPDKITPRLRNAISLSSSKSSSSREGHRRHNTRRRAEELRRRSKTKGLPSLMANKTVGNLIFRCMDDLKKGARSA